MYFQYFPSDVYPVYQNVYQNVPGTRCGAAGTFFVSTKLTRPCLPKRYVRDFDETRIPCSAITSRFPPPPPKGRYAPLGYAVVAPVTWETCAYTARYVTKKLTGPQAEFYTLHNLVPEFAHMSRDGGIGKQWYLDHPGCAAEDYLFLKTDKGGRKFRPPKYYQSMFELEDPEMAAEVKARRRKVAELALDAELRGTNLTYLEYLAVKEAALKARTKSLVRSDI